MQPNESPAGKSSGSKAARTGPSVLLVEGEDPLRALLRRIVESEGHEVLEARNSSEALSLLSGAARSVRLVLADLAEPGVAGPQGLRKHIPRGAKLLLLSTANEKTWKGPGGGDGVAFYLANPLRPDVLAETVRDLLRDPSERKEKREK
jgi:DNA-binding response OmpR family regulator